MNLRFLYSNVLEIFVTAFLASEHVLTLNFIMVEFGFKYSVSSVGFSQPRGSYMAVYVLPLPFNHLQMNLFFYNGMDAFEQFIG